MARDALKDILALRDYLSKVSDAVPLSSRSLYLVVSSTVLALSLGYTYSWLLKRKQKYQSGETTSSRQAIHFKPQQYNEQKGELSSDQAADSKSKSFTAETERSSTPILSASRSSSSSGRRISNISQRAIRLSRRAQATTPEPRASQRLLRSLPGRGQHRKMSSKPEPPAKRGQRRIPHRARSERGSRMRGASRKHSPAISVERQLLTPRLKRGPSSAASRNQKDTNIDLEAKIKDGISPRSLSARRKTTPRRKELSSARRRQ